MTSDELITLCTKLLHEYWDPIGGGVPENEYEDYAPRVAEYVRTEAPGAIGAYLANVRAVSMRLPEDALADSVAAHDIYQMAWRAWTAPTCNWCGCSCMTKGGRNHIGEKFEVVGGYDSTPGNGEGALDDCSVYHFALCEFCLDHLFTLFRLPPEVNFSGEAEPFRPAAQRVRVDEWRKGKDEFFVEQARRAAEREKKA